MPYVLIDSLVGQRFSRLVVTAIAPSKFRKRHWQCACDCGNEIVVCTSGLRNGHTRSCGCMKLEAAHKVIHGQARKKRTETYQTWLGLRTRPAGFCDRWSSFENFLEDMGERPKGMSLDRINNAQGYSKENCRWASRVTQTRNRTNTKMVTYEGVTKPLAQWAEELGLKYETLYQRLLRMPLERAMTKSLATTA